MNLTPNEILIISLVALIALGPKQLPDAVRRVAKGITELRRHTSELRTQVSSVVDKSVEDSHDVELQRQVQETEDLKPHEDKTRESE